jgi:pilin isopeptide linkage protein
LVNGSSDFEKADGTKFAFTLKQTGGSTCYIGPSPYQAFKDSVITINGTGTALSDELYFFKSGEYTFTLTENDLTGSEAEGYTKDQTQYDITIEVVAEGDALKVTKATYVKHGEDDAKELTNAVLTFDNKYDTVEEVMATPVSTKKSKTGAVKTGDQTQIGLYGTLFGVSALVLALAEKERRRRRR